LCEKDDEATVRDSFSHASLLMGFDDHVLQLESRFEEVRFSLPRRSEELIAR